MPLLKLREEEFQLRKFFSLFLNEMLKIRKKVAVFVMLIVMTVGMIGCSVIFKIEENIGEDNYDEEYVENCIENENWFKKEIETLLKNSDTEDPYYKDALYKFKIEWHYNYLYGTYTKENNITENSFKAAVTGSLHNYYEQMIYAELYSGAGTESEQYKLAKSEYDRLDEIIKTSNYKQYIEDENKRIEESEMPDEHKKSSIAYNNALYKICPTGEFGSYRARDNAEYLLSEKENIENALEKGIDLNTEGSISDAQVSDLVRFMLCEMKDEHTISCKCSDNDGEYDFELKGNNVEIFCTKCASKTLEINSVQKAADFLYIDNLTLE